MSSVTCKSSVAAFKQVEVNNNEIINLDITSEYPAGDVLGYKFLQIIPDIHPNLQNKTIEVRTNSVQTITSDNGYDGLGEVVIDTLVTPNLEDKTVDINSSGTNYITASTGYDGLGIVTINTTLPDPRDPIILDTIYLKDGSNNSYTLSKYDITEQTTSGVHTFDINLSYYKSNTYQYVYIIGVNYKADPCTLFAKRCRFSYSNRYTYTIHVNTTSTIFGMYYLVTDNDTNGYFEICQGGNKIFYLTPSRNNINSNVTETFNLEPRASYSSGNSFSIIDIPSNNKIEAEFSSLFENV